LRTQDPFMLYIVVADYRMCAYIRQTFFPNNVSLNIKLCLPQSPQSHDTEI